MLAEADTNNDGVVDFDEFCEVIRVSKQWNAIETGYADTLFNVTQELVRPIQSAVQHHTVVHVHRVDNGKQLAAPSACGRFMAFLLGAIVFPVTVLMLGLGIVLLILGWTHSQAHLGHGLFGYVVVSQQTGKPVGAGGVILRLICAAILPGLLGIPTAGIGTGAYYLLDVLSVLLSGNRIVDTLLGQQVVFDWRLKPPKR